MEANGPSEKQDLEATVAARVADAEGAADFVNDFSVEELSSSLLSVQEEVGNSNVRAGLRGLEQQQQQQLQKLQDGID